MSEELVTTGPAITDLAGVLDAGVEFTTETALAGVEEVMTATSFLPRLQLNSANSKIVAEGKSILGIFCLVYSKDKHVDLGKEVVFVSFSTRPRAMRMPERGNPISYFDAKSADFMECAAVASKGGMTGCMFGPEFLIWIPSQNTFATFFHSSETMRRVAPAVVQIMRSDANNPSSPIRPAAIRGKMKYIAPVTSKFTWWGYDAVAESSPIPPFPDGFRELMLKELEKFKNPPVSEIEVAPEPATSNDRVR